MRNKSASVLLGLFFLVIGVGFAGKAFDLWSFELFFEGWWTLFIIIPCLASMIQSGINPGNGIGMAVGVMLLLSARDIVSWDVLGKILLPAVLIIIGFSIIFKSFFADGFKKPHFTNNADSIPEYFAIFSGHDVKINNEKFVGANATAIFGGVELNLINSVIDSDVEISATAIFGGIDIYVPANVNVKASGIPLFGGASNKAERNIPNAPTIYINYTAMFGGVEIK